MKKLIAVLALIISSSVFGQTTPSTIPLSDVVCTTGQTAFCMNPGPGVTSLYYSPDGGLMIVVVNGVTYTSAKNTATWDGGIVYANDGSWRQVETSFALWTTTTRSGRVTATVKHHELKEGTISIVNTPL